MGMDLETYIHLSERVSLLEVSKCFPLYLHISKLKPKLQKCHTITVKFIAITAIAMFKAFFLDMNNAIEKFLDIKI